LGLGANLGKPLLALRRAAKALAAADGLELFGRSSVYRTAPLGGPPQPDYFNAAVGLRCALDPLELLEIALQIERQLGRKRPDPVRWGPRTMDIDVLWLSSGTVDLEGLRIPHPRLTQRAFALRPLLDVLPEASDPVSGQPYSELAVARAPIDRITDL